MKFIDKVDTTLVLLLIHQIMLIIIKSWRLSKKKSLLKKNCWASIMKYSWNLSLIQSHWQILFVCHYQQWCVMFFFLNQIKNLWGGYFILPEHLHGSWTLLSNDNQYGNFYSFSFIAQNKLFFLITWYPNVLCNS